MPACQGCDLDRRFRYRDPDVRRRASIDPEEFVENGYVIVRNIIPPDQLDSLRAGFEMQFEKQRLIEAARRTPDDPVQRLGAFADAVGGDAVQLAQFRDVARRFTPAELGTLFERFATVHDHQRDGATYLDTMPVNFGIAEFISSW